MRGFELVRTLTLITEIIILIYLALCLAGINTRAITSALIRNNPDGIFNFFHDEFDIILAKVYQEGHQQEISARKSLGDVFVSTTSEVSFIFSVVCVQFYYFLMWDWEKKKLSFYFIILSIGGQFSSIWLYQQLMGEEYQLSGKLFFIEIFCLYIPTTIKMLKEKGITEEQMKFLTIYAILMIILMDWDKGLFEQFNAIILFFCPYIQIYHTYITKDKIVFSSFGWILYISLFYSIGYSILMFFHEKRFNAPFGILQTLGWFVITALTFLIIFCRYGIIDLKSQLQKMFHFSLCMSYRFFNKRYEEEELCHVCLKQIYPKEDAVSIKKISEVEEIDTLVKLHCGHRFHFGCLSQLIKNTQVCPVDSKKIK